MNRWKAQGVKAECREFEPGEAACPQCPCVLTSLAVAGKITCDCRCHETQRWLTR